MWRRARTKRRDDGDPGADEPVGPFVSAVDAALVSLRGRRQVRGASAVSLFDALDAAIEPDTQAVVQPLLQQARDEVDGEAVVPSSLLADRLLDLRSAATTGPSIPTAPGGTTDAAAGYALAGVE